MDNNQETTNQGTEEDQLETQAAPLSEEQSTTAPEEVKEETQESPSAPEQPVVEATATPEVINAAPVAVVAPVVAPAPVAAPVVTETTKVPEPAPLIHVVEANKTTVGLEALISDIRKNGTTSQKSLISSIESYIQNMKPGMIIDVNKGAQHQYTLWKAIQNLVENCPEGEFKKLWSILLAYAEDQKNGVFGDRYAFRFAEYWQQSEDELTAYQRILNLVKLTSNPEERAKGLRQVDIKRSLDQGFSEAGRQRIVSFYS